MHGGAEQVEHGCISKLFLTSEWPVPGILIAFNRETHEENDANFSVDVCPGRGDRGGGV